MGRQKPCRNDCLPVIVKLRLWASDPTRARSKFWHFARKLCKLKSTKGHIISCDEVSEKSPTGSKNFGLWIRYQSRTGYHNAFKEYRDLSMSGAVEQMYKEMSSRHRTDSECIQLIKTAEIPPQQCKRVNTLQYHDGKIEFPLTRKMLRPSSKKYRTLLKGKRPQIFWRKKSESS